MKFIAVCTPSRPSGAVSVWWARQLADLLRPLNMGIRHVMVRDSVGGEVAETRNKIVVKTLALETVGPEVDSFFWLDDDVLVPRGALIKLYEHHRPIASGTYFTKGEPGQPLIFPGRVEGTLPFVPDEVREVWGTCMGLTLVRAEVYKAMLKKGLPTDKYGSPEWYRTDKQYKVEGTMLDCGGTEDLYFLDAAGKLGYKTLLDCSKWTFGWHFDLDRQQGYPRKQFDQWASSTPVVWDLPDGRTVTWE